MMPSADLLSIFDSVSYAVVALDLDCRVLYLNKGAKLFLHKRGRNVEDCLGGPGDQILPLATPKARKALTTAEFKAGVGRIVDKGNQLFFEITPLMQEGRLAGAVISLQRPERFEQMACSLETYQNLARRLQTIFDSSSDGIWVTDENGVVLDINHASERLNGLNAATLRGQNVRNILERGLIDDSVTMRVLKTKRQ